MYTSGGVTGSSSVAGGLNGTSTTDFSPFGATPGGPGVLVTNVLKPMSRLRFPAQIVCRSR